MSQPGLIVHVAYLYDPWSLLDNDILSTAQGESRLREAMLGTDPGQTRATSGTGLDNPVSSGRSETKPTCVRSVLLGMKELCRENGLNEDFTAYLVGRLALGLCYSDPPNINQVV